MKYHRRGVRIGTERINREELLRLGFFNIIAFASKGKKTIVQSIAPCFVSAAAEIRMMEAINSELEGTLFFVWDISLDNDSNSANEAIKKPPIKVSA